MNHRTQTKKNAIFVINRRTCAFAATVGPSETNLLPRDGRLIVLLLTDTRNRGLTKMKP